MYAGKAAGTDTAEEAKLKTRLDPDQEILTAGGLKTSKSKPQTVLYTSSLRPHTLVA